MSIKATLVFDGYCGFCTRAVRFIRRLDRHGQLEIVPWQQSGVLNEVGLTREQVRDAAWLIEGSKQWRGAGAINAALGIVTSSNFFVAVYQLPGIHQIQNIVYAWVAEHRHLFRGVGPHCKDSDANCVTPNKSSPVS